MGGGPLQPEAAVHPQLHMEHSVQQGGGHGLCDGVVVGAVPRAHDDGPLRQPVLPDPPLQDQGVECLLHLLGAGVQFVQKQAVGTLPGDHAGRAEDAAPLHDLGHADDILRRQLAAQQGDALQAHVRGELFHNGGLPDPGWSPDKDRTDGTHVQKHVHQLLLVYRYR